MYHIRSFMRKCGVQGKYRKPYKERERELGPECANAGINGRRDLSCSHLPIFSARAGMFIHAATPLFLPIRPVENKGFDLHSRAGDAGDIAVDLAELFAGGVVVVDGRPE